MSTLFIILAVVYIAFCMFFVSVVLLQKKRNSGIGNLNGGMGTENNSMGRTKEDNLSRLTKILGFVFMLFTFLIGYVN
ncbi:MAG: preprotein translocase subunit SecG [Lachnospirales bacterium]